jgi:hypothetical protein
MSGVIRRAHLVLVAAFGKRVADPPMTRQERERAEALARARARAAQKRSR